MVVVAKAQYTAKNHAIPGNPFPGRPLEFRRSKVQPDPMRGPEENPPGFPFDRCILCKTGFPHRASAARGGSIEPDHRSLRFRVRSPSPLYPGDGPQAKTPGGILHPVADRRRGPADFLAAKGLAGMGLERG